jgi:hypothetical protein
MRGQVVLAQSLTRNQLSPDYRLAQGIGNDLR